MPQFKHLPYDALFKSKDIVTAVAIGKVVRGARLAKKLKQAALAAQVDADESTISRIESGRLIPNPVLTKALEKGLGLHANHLLTMVYKHRIFEAIGFHVDEANDYGLKIDVQVDFR